jgi:hypothetical protein
VHPAWLVGLAIIILQWFAFDVIAKSSIGVAIYDAVVEGTPAAGQPALQKHLPPG